MKKRSIWKALGLFAAVILLAVFGLLQLDSAEKEDELARYHQQVASFSKISVEEVKEKQEKDESFYLYIGRGTCPYCRRFVQVLQKADSVEFYYLDSEIKTAELTQFRTSYGIKYVPYFGKFSGKKESKVLKINPQTSRQDILDFVDK